MPGAAERRIEPHRLAQGLLGRRELLLEVEHDSELAQDQRVQRVELVGARKGPLRLAAAAGCPQPQAPVEVGTRVRRVQAGTLPRRLACGTQVA